MTGKYLAKNKYRVIAVVLVLLLTVFLTAYLSYQSGFQNGNEKGLSSGVDIAKKYLNGKEEKLVECLAEAKNTYKRKVELNSTAAPTKNYPDARLWNDSEISEVVEGNYNKDREFCLKLYK